MKAIHFRVLPFVLILLFVSADVLAMPLHPRLKEKLKSGELAPPVALRDRSALLARGVDTPHRVNLFPSGGAQKTTQQESFKSLVLLVDFTDNVSQVEASFYDGLVFGSGTGTVNDFYNEVSYGTFSIITDDPPSTIGWVRAPQSYAYYVDGQQGFGDYPQNAQKLVEDVVAAADPSIDFSQYDYDGDGYVDGLFIVHAGSGAEFTGSNDDIWSHKWQTHTPPLVDGVYVDVYSMEPEYWLTPGDMTCGVFAHEMGHAVFGLPDLYDTDYSSEGIGDWSLMAGGSWNAVLGESPAHPDAWCLTQMGFLTPTDVTEDMLGASIPAVENEATCYRLWGAGVPGSQYFLIENRQPIGYDAGLPGSGLLIYHVDETVVDQNDNEWYPGYTNYGHYLVAVEQADGDWDLEQGVNRGDSGDPYPGSTSNMAFDASSVPNSNDYLDQPSGVAVTNISGSSSTMTADLSVTGPVVNNLKPPYNLSAIHDGNGNVDLIWSRDFYGYTEDFTDGVADGFEFSNPSVFSVADDNLKGMGIYADDYHTAMYTGDSFGDQTVETEVNLQSGYGDDDVLLLLRGSGMLGDDHSYSGYAVDMNLEYGDVGFYRFDGSMATLFDYFSAPLNSSGYNVLTVQASGSQFDIYVNGTYVGTVMDGTYASGHAGVVFSDWYDTYVEAWWNRFTISGSAVLTPIAQKDQITPTQPQRQYASAHPTRRPRPASPVQRAHVQPVQLLPGLVDPVFQEYRVYRDSEQLGATPDTTYQDQLPDYGLYAYTVTAAYDSGESVPAGPVYVNWETTELFPPVNLVSEHLGDGLAKLTWQTPDTAAVGLPVLGYNVYRDFVLVGTVVDTTFQEQLPDYGSYLYQVTAVYDPGESVESNPVWVTWSEPLLPRPRFLTADHDGEGTVDLAWQAPSDTGFVENFDDGVADGFELVQPSDFTVEEGYLKQHGTGQDDWPTAFYAQEEFTDGTVEAEFARLDGDQSASIGLMFRCTGTVMDVDIQGYQICTTSDGWYSAWVLYGADYANLIPWTSTDVINTGYEGSNVVTVEMVGSTFNLYINGSFVDSFVDAAFPYGKVGVGAYDSPADYPNDIWWNSLAFSTESLPVDVAAHLPQANTSRTTSGSTDIAHSPAGASAFASSGMEMKHFTGIKHLLPVEKVGATLTGYSLYRNDELITTGETTAYQDLLPDFGTYAYTVVANYDAGDSNPSYPAAVVWAAPPLYAPRHLTVVQADGPDVSLQWNTPGPPAGFLEDFDDGVADDFVFDPPEVFSISSGWLTATGTDADEWMSGYYSAELYGDVVAEMQARRDSGPEYYSVGMLLRGTGNIHYYTSDYSGYLIAITWDGAYSAWIETAGEESNLIPWTDSGLINTGLGAVNTLTVEAVGSTFYIYVNGAYLDSFVDGTYADGYVGVATYDVETGNVVSWNYFSASEDVSLAPSRKGVEVADHRTSEPNGTGARHALTSSAARTTTSKMASAGFLSPLFGKRTEAVFQQYNLYRNDLLLDTTTDTTYQDQLPGEGRYEYYVTATYDLGESNPSNTVTVAYQPLKPFALLYPGNDMFVLTDEAPVGWTSAFASAQGQPAQTSKPPKATVERYMDSKRPRSGKSMSRAKGSTAFDGIGVPQNRSSGGPDGFGYQWIDSNEPGGPQFNWVEISGTGTSWYADDDEVISVPMPFTFNYYGVPYTTVNISSNGNIHFGPADDDYDNTPIPDLSGPAAMIAPFWDDLYPPGGGTIYYQTETDRVIVEWQGIESFDDESSSYTFQVILHSNGSIQFQYQSMVGTVLSATVGIENPSQTDGLQIVYDAAYLEDGLAIAIESSYVEGPHYVVQWSAQSDFSTFSQAVTADTFFVITDLTDLVTIGPNEYLDSSRRGRSLNKSGRLSSTAETPEKILPDNVTVHWRVKAVDPDVGELWAIPGDHGWRFHVYLPEAPAPFSLLTPPDSTVLDTLVSSFTWNASADNDPWDTLSYWLEISLGDAFADSNTAHYNANGDTVYKVPFLMDDTHYWWRVHAMDTNTLGTYSTEAWTFETAWPQPPEPFVLLTPENHAAMGYDGNFDFPMSWEIAVDPDPGEESVYELVFQMTLPDKGDTTYRIPMDTTACIVNLVSELGMADWQETPVTWWVEAISGEDRVLSTEAFDFTMASSEYSDVADRRLANLPTRFEITSVYPNPFNPTLTAVVGLPQSSDLRVRVYNIMGRVVAELANGRFNEGYHNFTFNGSGMASGIYIIHAYVPGRLDQVKKVVLMK